MHPDEVVCSNDKRLSDKDFDGTSASETGDMFESIYDNGNVMI